MCVFLRFVDTICQRGMRSHETPGLKVNQVRRYKQSHSVITNPKNSLVMVASQLFGCCYTRETRWVLGRETWEFYIEGVETARVLNFYQLTNLSRFF